MFNTELKATTKKSYELEKNFFISKRNKFCFVFNYYFRAENSSESNGILIYVSAEKAVIPCNHTLTSNYNVHFIYRFSRPLACDGKNMVCFSSQC